MNYEFKRRSKILGTANEPNFIFFFFIDFQQKAGTWSLQYMNI